MEVTKVIELTQAGFTPEQLSQLNDYNLDDVSKLIEGGMTPTDVIGVLGVLDKTTITPPEPPTNEPPQNDPPQSGTDFNALSEEIKSIKNMLQAKNIQTSRIDNKPVEANADSVIRSLFEANKEDK